MLKTPITRETVAALLADWRSAFDNGDWAFFERLLSHDIEMTWHGPPQAFPIPNAVHGRAAALEAFRQNGEALMIVRNVVRFVMVDGDWASAVMDRTVTQRMTGRTLVYRLAAFLRFRNAQLAEYQAFYDSFDMLEQVIGRTLDVPPAYPHGPQ